MVGKYKTINSSNGQLIKKRKVITLEEKLLIIQKYEEGQTLSGIARMFDMAVSTVNTIVKDKERIKDYVKDSATMKASVISKKRNNAFTEMETMLAIWIKNQTHKRVPLTLSMIQAKARSIYNSLKEKSGETDTVFVASHSWFNRFKARTNLYSVNISDDATHINQEETQEISNLLEALIEPSSQTFQGYWATCGYEKVKWVFLLFLGYLWFSCIIYSNGVCSIR